MAQGVGYLLAAAGPFVLGALHDATDDWTAPMLLLAALCVPMGIAGVGAGRDRRLDDEHTAHTLTPGAPAPPAADPVPGGLLVRLGLLVRCPPVCPRERTEEGARVSATADARRRVRVAPADPEAAAVLRSWARQGDSLLDVTELDLSHTDLSGLDLAVGLLTGTVLRGARLVGTDLYRAHMEGAVLEGADLSRACLTKAILDEADLRGAVLVAASLGSAELYGVDARAASFRGARLNGASFLDARLEGADLTGASVRETSLKAVLDDRTRVEGLTGTVFGPARLEGSGPPHELAGPALEKWLNSRGAAVQVLGSRPAPRTDARTDARTDRASGNVRNRPFPPAGTPSTTPTSTSSAR
ncbi:pentapeptide repeat-containing protein [Streptomyces sp. NPDC058142]|uniref:pentapeptide repeat-containing protein n=1 Tax=Streptomyces sp. NPDC058142 TaxID=3346355 RepID=UPI0036DFB9CF